MKHKESFTLEKVMRVWDDKEGVYIEVFQNPDYPDAGIVIRTDAHEESIKFYGSVNLPLNSKSQALKLAQAIIEMAEQIKE